MRNSASRREKNANFVSKAEIDHHRTDEQMHDIKKNCSAHRSTYAIMFGQIICGLPYTLDAHLIAILFAMGMLRFNLCSGIDVRRDEATTGVHCTHSLDRRELILPKWNLMCLCGVARRRTDPCVPLQFINSKICIWSTRRPAHLPWLQNAEYPLVNTCE